jgi:hypothetical protein
MAGLVRRSPRRAIKIGQAAALLACSSESIRTGAIGRFKLFKQDPAKRNSAWLVHEAEVLDFIERREREDPAQVY